MAVGVLEVHASPAVEVVDLARPVAVRAGVVRDGRALRPNVDWPPFADDWRRLYRPTLERVIRGELPWATFD